MKGDRVVVAPYLESPEVWRVALQLLRRQDRGQPSAARMASPLMRQ